MTTQKRGIGRRAVIIGALTAPTILRAQGTYPNKVVHYINPFSAGGATDLLSRLFCAKISELCGQQWIVENRTGAGGNIGMLAVAKALPDGYTLGMASIATHGIAPTLYTKLPFNAHSDFTFISTLWQLPNMLVINPSLPANSVPELIELLRANPGKYSYASAGTGGSLHLSGELFKSLAKVDMLHVPYRGGSQAMQDVLAGNVHMVFDNIPNALTFWRAGKVRALGVTSTQRNPAAPDIPAIAEILPGYEINSWTALIGPAGLPSDMVGKLSDLTKKVLESDEIKTKFRDNAAQPIWRTPEETLAFRDSEELRLVPIIRASGARVD